MCLSQLIGEMFEKIERGNDLYLCLCAGHRMGDVFICGGATLPSDRMLVRASGAKCCGARSADNPTLTTLLTTQQYHANVNGF